MVLCLMKIIRFLFDTKNYLSLQTRLLLFREKTTTFLVAVNIGVVDCVISLSFSFGPKRGVYASIFFSFQTLWINILRLFSYLSVCFRISFFLSFSPCC